VILAELWSCGQGAARSPHDGVEALDVRVQGTPTRPERWRSATSATPVNCHRATAYRRNRGSTFAAINHPSASRNLCQNHLPCKFTNIDHLAVTASGVYIIDAKRYTGRLHLRVDGDEVTLAPISALTTLATDSMPCSLDRAPRPGTVVLHCRSLTPEGVPLPIMSNAR